ncbi:MAG: coproporphyrinogen-III oxidase family protein [Chloroflexota bacterium]
MTDGQATDAAAGDLSPRPADAAAGDGAPPAAGDGAPRAAPPVALYVHLPFCVSLCPYCDFVVFAGTAARGPGSRIAAFVDALLVEIDLRADVNGARHGAPGAPGRPALETVYLGGGTPSLLPAAAITRILDAVRRRFGIAPGAEVTLEANPGPEDRGDVAGAIETGVTRISLGAQSLDAAELRRLGRRHGPADVADAVAAARAAGAASVSLDLLYDVPGQTDATWDATLVGALDLAPDHLSLYALTLDDPDAEGITGPTGDHLPTNPGARRWRDRARVEQDGDRAAAQYERASDVLAAAGFRGYELSNWALPGHESRHNLAYWERRPYEAVGPGAHAFDGVVRRWNAARLEGYLAALLPGAAAAEGARGAVPAPRPSTRPGAAAQPVLPPGGSETIDADAAAVEAAILGLRLDHGIPLAVAEAPRFAAAFAWARDTGLVEDVAPGVGRRGVHRLRLTRRGRLLSNELFARLV